MPSGWLVDKLPGHAVLAAALAFQAVGFVAIPFCTSMAALAGAFSCVALSWNIINTAGNTYVLHIAAERSRQTRRRGGGGGGSDGGGSDADGGDGGNGAGDGGHGSSVLINLVNALFGVGSLAAPLLAEVCATRLAAPMAAYWITAAATAASAVSFVLLPSPQPPGSSSGSDGPQQPLLAGEAAEAGREGGADAAAAPAAAAGGAAADGGSGDKPWSRPRLLLLGIIALFNLLNVGTEVGFGGWIFTYAIKQGGLSEHAAHAVNAGYWLAFTLGRVIASAAALVASPVTLLLASLPLALLGSVAALVAPAAWMAQQGSALLLCVTVLVGLGVAPGFANTLALLDSYHPCTGSITGLLGGVAGAGCMTVPLLVALLAKHTTLRYQGLMWVALGSFGVQLLCIPLALLVGEQLSRGSLARRCHASVTKDLGLAAADEQLQQPAGPAAGRLQRGAAAPEHC